MNALLLLFNMREFNELKSAMQQEAQPGEGDPNGSTT